MNDNTLYKTHSEVVSTATGDELVLLSFKTDTYYGLNPVGARMWELLGQGASVDTLCATLIGEYSVSEEVLRNDIRAVMNDLDAQSLIVMQQG
ncbi:PqqD family protein [Mameliella alba]|uniref:PqqD family protein n=1 Tax=Mameliella alba TaxID=561184 RepID=UPI0013FD4E1F|nr:PqqD family protein [Mameliella alba]